MSLAIFSGPYVATYALMLDIKLSVFLKKLMLILSTSGFLIFLMETVSMYTFNYTCTYVCAKVVIVYTEHVCSMYIVEQGTT